MRTPSARLLALPWDRPLAEWPDDELAFRHIPVGPSRHLVRFLDLEGVTYALKEMSLDGAGREYAVLRHLERLGLPSVAPVGIAEAPERAAGILLTEYLRHSLQYRRLLMRFPAGPGVYRERLLDAMAWLLVDLHRSGVFWGDCSLANTLFRRDGERLQAYLVDAETSEVHPSLSDGQRAYDLDVLVENVAFGLADLAAYQGRLEELGEVDDAIRAAEAVRGRYLAVWAELHEEPELRAEDRHAVAGRIRRLNDLGFAIDEIELVPGAGPGRIRVRAAVTTRQFHSRRLEQLTGLVALEGQATLLLNDLRGYQAWLEHDAGTTMTREEGARRWLADVLRPSLDRLAPAIGPQRDALQAYCDVLETKWIISERAGRDVGLDAAIASYLEQGAPAPEGGDAGPMLDLESDEERPGEDAGTSG